MGRKYQIWSNLSSDNDMKIQLLANGNATIPSKNSLGLESMAYYFQGLPLWVMSESCLKNIYAFRRMARYIDQTLLQIPVTLSLFCSK